MSEPFFAFRDLAEGAPWRRVLATGLLAAVLSMPALAQEETAQSEEAESETAQQEEADESPEANAEADALREELAERERELRQARRELSALRARLPPEEGGELDAESARASARVTAQALRNARRELARAGGSDAALETEVEELEAELARDQRLLARAQEGMLYRVRRGESLAGIAARFYGDANRWQRIHEANAHVLEDPDRVRAGMLLLLP